MRRYPALLFCLTFLLAEGSALASNTPNNVQVFTRADIIGRNFYSVADLLLARTNLNLERDGGRGTRSVLKIRGTSDSNRTLVLMDGRPLTHEFGGRVDLTQTRQKMIHFDQVTVTYGNRSVTVIPWVCVPQGWKAPVNPRWQHDGMCERPYTYIMSTGDLALLKKKGQQPTKLRKIVYALRRAVQKGVLE